MTYIWHTPSTCDGDSARQESICVVKDAYTWTHSRAVARRRGVERLYAQRSEETRREDETLTRLMTRAAPRRAALLRKESIDVAMNAY